MATKGAAVQLVAAEVQQHKHFWPTDLDQIADNALVKAAQVVTRLADYRPSPYVDELWAGFVASLGLDLPSRWRAAARCRG